MDERTSVTGGAGPTDAKRAVSKEFVAAHDGLRVVRLALAPGGSIPEHFAPVDVVVTVVRGEGRFSVRGESRAVAVGDVVVLAPREPHALETTRGLEVIVVHARIEAGDTTCGART